MARQAEQDPTNLYIANLPHSVKESDLETMFSPYGQVFIIVLLKKVEDKDDEIIIVIPTITIMGRWCRPESCGTQTSNLGGSGSLGWRAETSASR